MDFKLNKRQFLITSLLKGIILFSQNSLGTIVAPYKTYRRLSTSRHFEQLLPLGLIVAVYFWFSNVLRYGLLRNPLIMATGWVETTTGALITFLLVVSGIYIGSLIVGGKGKLVNLFLPWGYSLLPTLIWFIITSISFLLIPPPRTTSFTGQVFSFLFIVGSLIIFLWKGILYYLTLRFGMRLDLYKILLVSSGIFPAGILYSLLMYKLGIFRIPFI